jgi:hypothetical protein
MFINYLDASTWDGPREATERDMVEHSEALANQGHEPPPLAPPVKVAEPQEPGEDD